MGYFRIAERVTEPPTPPTGKKVFWVDGDDGILKCKDDAGVSSNVGGNVTNAQRFFDSNTSTQTEGNENWIDIAEILNETLVGGDYKIDVSLVWRYTSTSSNINFRILVDGVQLGQIISKEPKDSNSDVREHSSLFKMENLTAGQHTVTLQMKSGNDDHTAYAYETFLTLEEWKL